MIIFLMNQRIRWRILEWEIWFHYFVLATIPVQIQKYYKCIVATQPRASIAIFYYDKDDKIKFWGMRKEEKVEPTIGYPHTGPGDSGSPIWTHVTYPGEDLAEDSDPNLDEKGRNENSYQNIFIKEVIFIFLKKEVIWIPYL